VIAGLAMAAALAAPFAPPLDTPLHYRTAETRPATGGDARVTLDETLRFARAEGGYRATVIAGESQVDAPAAYRDELRALMAPFTGVATNARLSPAGAITGIEDGAATWRAIVASGAALEARLDADPAMTAQAKTVVHALIAQTLGDLPPAARDARLSDAVAALLAPRLPALAPGEARAFEARVASPAGTLPAKGTVTLAAVDADMLHFVIEAESDPAALAPALVAMNASLAAAAPAQRAAIAASTAALAGMAYLERTELAVDRATGLLRHSRTVRQARGRDGALHPLNTSLLDRID
jgi:hypothetical protein